MISVARRYFFEAEHQVFELQSPWNERHGHKYTVEVVAEADLDSDDLADGLVVIDTDDLDKVWGDLEEFLGGTYLNDSTPTSTTVEALAAWVLDVFDILGDAVREVTVWEDQTRWGRARRR